MRDLLVPAAALVASAVCAACGGGTNDAQSRPWNALLITLDTTRPRAVGAYGEHPGLTPNLDRIAAEGVVYTAARTVAPLTLPAHASILTGLYPPRHTVRANSAMALPEEAVTFAELARERGYETAAFVGAVVLDSTFGLAQGFDRYDQPQAPPSMLEQHYESRPAGAVVDAALAWYAERDPAKPFFAWLHVYDPHAPYEPPAEYAERAGGDLYLGEAAWMDAELGRFLDALQGDGADERTAIVVVADHGEGLGEHGEATHGFYCFDSTMLVPLIVRLPGGARAGTRSDAVVSVVDVLPTLCEALELPLPGPIDGRSLLAPVPAERGVYFEAFFGYMSLGWSHLAGWATRAGKYLHSSEPIFFDLERDPNEREDVLAERAADAERYRAEIRRVGDEPALAPAAIHGAEDLMEKLAALGYTGAGSAQQDLPQPADPSARKSPHACIELYADLQRAQDLSFHGRPADALKILERVVAASPENPAAQFQLAGALVQLRRYEEALPHLAENLRLRGSWRGVHIQLGLCYQALGRKEEAVRELELALEHDPGLEQIEGTLIALLEELGRTDEANRRRIERLERAAER